MDSIILLSLLVVFILLGAPVGFTLILLPTGYILLTDAAPLTLIPFKMFDAIDSIPLTAIPFFILTGELMTSATITDRLVEFSRRIIGRMRGSMAQVNVLVSMFFAGMNGSVVADTATVGSLLIPAMKRAGYPAAFSAGITAVSATIGGIIPPSIAMIILANAGGISVGALFAGGIIPGIMIGAMLMVINWMIATRKNFERSEEPFSWRLMGKAGANASFAMIIPIVLVGSVLGGIAGVVEAGAITAATALLVGIFIYKAITWENCRGAFVRAFRTSATVFIIIAAAGPFSWLLTSLGAIKDLEVWLLSYADSPLLAGADQGLRRGGISRSARGPDLRRRLPDRHGDAAPRGRLLHRGGDRARQPGKRGGGDAALSRGLVRHAVPAGGRSRFHHVAAHALGLRAVGERR